MSPMKKGVLRRHFALCILSLAFAPHLAIGQPAITESHPPVHTVAMVGQNTSSGNLTIKTLHFCQSIDQMEETDYDSNTDTWSSPVSASGIGPLNQVGQQPFSIAAFGSLTNPIYWTLFDLALLNTIESSYGIATPDAIWHYQYPNGQPSPIPSQNMLPISMVAYVDPDGVQRANAFGLSSDGQNLLEGWLYRYTWSYWNHGNPAEYFYGTPASLLIAPGSAGVGGGANGYPDEFVFVTGIIPRPAPQKEEDPATSYRVYAAYDYANHSWNWQDLGNVSQTNCLGSDVTGSFRYACDDPVGAPLAVIHPWQGSTRVHVFVPWYSQEDGEWRVAERFADRQADGSYHWSSWDNKGPLPPSVGDGVRFTFTQAIVWYFNSTLRIDVFGVTADSQSGCPGNYLFDFRWDGHGWQTIPVGRSPTNCTHVQTTSAAVF
jgi:hypothetical protein